MMHTTTSSAIWYARASLVWSPLYYNAFSSCVQSHGRSTAAYTLCKRAWQGYQMIGYDCQEQPSHNKMRRADHDHEKSSSGVHDWAAPKKSMRPHSEASHLLLLLLLLSAHYGVQIKRREWRKRRPINDSSWFI